MKKLRALSIFFPAYNEAENIKNTINDALKIAPKTAHKFEIIVVDDGSLDQTASVVKAISEKNNYIKLISHPINLGYGSALKTGFYNAKYEYITYMDSDGQFNFSDLNKLIDKIDSADIVVGYRIHRADKLIRILNGKLWNLAVSILLRLNIKDIDCGFKLMKREVLDGIEKLESTGATISAELLVKARNAGFKITQVGLEHRPRRFGHATGGNPLHIFRAFYDLFVILPKIF